MKNQRGADPNADLDIEDDYSVCLHEFSPDTDAPNEDEPLPSDYISALVRYDNYRSIIGENVLKSDADPFTLDEAKPFMSKTGPVYGPSDCDCDERINLFSCRISSVDKNNTDPFAVIEKDLCDACLGPLTSDKAKCRHCGTTIHAKCYGLVHNSPSVFLFECDVCRNKTPGTKLPLCVICNTSGGIMRYNNAKKVWSHLSCRFFTGNSTVDFNTSSAPNHPFDARGRYSGYDAANCDACGLSSGILVPCSLPKCFRYLHSRCAMNRKSGYIGKAFSSIVEFKSPLGTQYFTFKGTFCQEHSDLEFVKTSLEMEIKRRCVLTSRRRSTYSKYQQVVYNLLIATKSVSNHNLDASGRLLLQNALIPTMKMTSLFSPPDYLETETEHFKHKRKLSDLINIFMNNSIDDTFESTEQFESDIDDEDELIVNIKAPETHIKIETPLEVQNTQKTDINDPNNKYRGQRLLWQKYEFFKRISFGPAALDILNHQDLVSRKKILQEILPLDSNLLSYDLLEPNELSECFIQQIFFNCKGILSLLDSIKFSLDFDAQNQAKFTPSSVNDAKYTRFHVLVDTGVSCGVVVFKANKKLLDNVLKCCFLENTDPSSLSYASVFIDQEIRHIISQVHNDLIRTTYATGTSNIGTKITNGKDVDFLTGIMAYGLKDDLRYLNSIMSLSSKESDLFRARRNILKKNTVSRPSLKNLQLEKFIPLSVFECEILKRCVFEMSLTTDVEMKLAVMSDRTLANRDSSCLNYIDWPLVMERIKSIIGDLPSATNTPISSLSKPLLHKTSQKNSQSLPKDVTTKGTVAAQTLSTQSSDIPQTPTVRLGRWFWPCIDNNDFVSGQKELLEAELKLVSRELSHVREKVCSDILEENSSGLRVSEKFSFYNMMLSKYEAVDRWSDLVNYISLGCRDVVDIPPQTQIQQQEHNNVSLVSKNRTSISRDSIKAESTHSISEPKKPLKKNASVAEALFCSVCFRCINTNLNPIYTCSRCYMNCHKNCYGIGRGRRDTDQADYICKRCEYEKRVLGGQWQTGFKSCSVICIICGRGGGAFKRCEGDDWAHVFCLLSLMPETKCNDYISLEPWNIRGVASWRKDELCVVCGINWGIVLKCTDCDVYAHPLCAWLHGFKFTVDTTYYHFFKGFNGDSLLQRIIFKFFCNLHDKDRNWVEQMSIRNKRFLNRDTASSLFENKEKKKKSQTQQSDSLVKNESLTLLNAARLSKCGVCFGIEARHQCRKCKLFVHDSCYMDSQALEYIQSCDEKKITCTGDKHSLSQNKTCSRDKKAGSSPSFIPSQKIEEPHSNAVERETYGLTFLCDPCRNFDSKARCSICERDSGVLKELPGKSAHPLYFHIICAICFPKDTLDLCLGVRRSDGHPCDSQVCDICSCRSGFKLDCFQKDCKVKFHPICGLNNKFIIEPNSMTLNEGEKYVAFCQQHSLVNNTVSNNIKLLLRLRLNLILLKNIIGDVASKDSVYQSLLRKKQEILNEECPIHSIIKHHNAP